MIRKSHSWSLTWTRDKSADQSGPSIVSLPSGQSQSRLQAHRANAGYTSPFGPRISYFSRGSLSSGERAGMRASVPCVYCIPPLVACSESVSIRVHPWFRSFVYALLFKFPFAIVRVRFAIIRIRSRTFAIIRDISTPLPPGQPKSAIRNTNGSLRRLLYSCPSVSIRGWSIRTPRFYVST